MVQMSSSPASTASDRPSPSLSSSYMLGMVSPSGSPLPSMESGIVSPSASVYSSQGMTPSIS